MASAALAPLFGLAAAGALLAVPGLGPLGEVLAFHSLLLGLVVGAAGAVGGAPIRERLGLVPPRFTPGQALAGVIGTLCLSNATFQLLLELDLLGRGTLGRIDDLVETAQGRHPGLALLALGLSAGVAEELTFRGFVQRLLASRWGPAIGIGLAALGFAAIHWDPVHSPAAFVLGAYLGVVAWAAGSVWPAILCHVANNLLGVGLGLIGAQPPQAGHPEAIGASLVATAACLWVLLRGRSAASSAPQASDGGADPT